jgi:hypothetical protein
MANIRKTFNFRNGVQVDDDNLIVDSLGKVGIGTSVPTEFLDVRGTAKVVGVLTATEVFTEDVYVTGIVTSTELNSGRVSISAGVVTATSGVVTYFGDGGRLLNLPTSQWLDVNSGLGFTSIYAQGFVGIATQLPSFVFQVGGNSDVNNFQNGVGLGSEGNVIATGILTAGFFVGNGVGINSINASEIFSGTISNSRLPIINNDRLPSNISVSGIVTAQNGFVGNVTGNVIGDVVGIATTARDLTSDANVTINSVTSSVSRSGISTINTRLEVNGTVGVNTATPQADFHLVKTGIGSAQVTSTTESTFTIGRSINYRTNTGQLRFGNINTLQRYSSIRSFDVINYDNGNFNFYIDVARTGINTGNFNWIWGGLVNTPLMTLTYSNSGRLGLGITNPTNTLHVVGTSTVTQNGYIGQDFYVGNNAIIGGNLTVNGAVQFDNIDGVNLYVNSGISTVYDISIQNNAYVSGRLGIRNSSPLGDLHVGDYIGVGSESFIASDGKIGINTTTISAGFGLDCSQSDASLGRLGVTTTSLRAAVDFGDAGFGIDDTKRFVLFPRLTTAQRNALIPVVGAVIFNTSADRLQVYTASGGSPGPGWVNI